MNELGNTASTMNDVKVLPFILSTVPFKVHGQDTDFPNFEYNAVDQVATFEGGLANVTTWSRSSTTSESVFWSDPDEDKDD